MKNIFLFLLLFNVLNTFSQDFAKLQDYKFKSKQDYKTQETEVKKCADYLFNNPASDNEMNRLVSGQFIMKWMEGTPDYTFQIGSRELDLTKGSPDLLTLLLAAMSKTVLENVGKKLSTEDIYKASETLLVNYCRNKDNNIKPSKKIKKLLKAK